MTTLQFVILMGTVVWLSLPILWLAFRACAAAEGIAHTLELAHEAELAWGKEAIASRQAALNRARGQAMWIDDDGKIADKPAPSRFGRGARA